MVIVDSSLDCVGFEICNNVFDCGFFNKSIDFFIIKIHCQLPDDFISCFRLSDPCACISPKKICPFCLLGVTCRKEVSVSDNRPPTVCPEHRLDDLRPADMSAIT